MKDTGFIRRVRQTIEANEMAGRSDRILVGLSGGPDSVALVRALLALKKQMGFGLGAAHLNHNLRGEESLRDERFAREFARAHQLDLAVDTQNIYDLARQRKRSLEETGRDARYAFFDRTARDGGYTRIATGHTWDDHVELVLMNLMRGAGPRGLKGIAPVRDACYIRPLIRSSKKEILNFLEEQGQEFVTDSSNSDPAFLRNRVRNRLIPLIREEFNPDIKTGLDRLSSIITLEDNYMEAAAGKAFKAAFLQSGPGRIAFSAPALASLHPAMVPRVLRQGILRIKQDLRRITHTHIRDIQDLLQAEGTPGKSLDLPGQIRVYLEKDRLVLVKEKIPLRELGRQRKQREKNRKAQPGTPPE